nr:hypothetical protein CTI12_AA046580 [Tanacetum cinerariifolium]
ANKEKAAASVESDWDVYSEYVVKHIHRIPREGVEALAERLLIDKNVVEACAGKAPLRRGGGARGGEWGSGSCRSGDEECFWGSPEKLTGKVFRRRRRWVTGGG